MSEIIRIFILTQMIYWIGYLVGKYRERARVKELIAKAITDGLEDINDKTQRYSKQKVERDE